MSNLGPQQQNQTYPGLLQVDGGISSTLKPVQDGDGNFSALWLSSQEAQVGGVNSASILQIPGGITTSLQTVKDGNGNPTGLSLSSSGASVTTSSTFVPSINGTQIPNAVPRLISDGFGDYVSVKDFGATGDGVTDDTAAIQTALNYAVQGNKRIFFPQGQYVVTSTITVQASFSGQGFGMIGVGDGSSANSAATLVWKGNSVSGVVLHLVGCCWSHIQNVNVASANIDTYPYLGAVFLDTYLSSGGSPGSSNVRFEDCIFNGGVGTGSYALKIGKDNYQVSEVRCNRVSCQSAYSSVGSAYVTNYGFYIGGTANTKDMTFTDCTQIFFTVAGVKYPTISGWHVWTNLGGGSSACDFDVVGNGYLTVIGGGSEGSGQVLNYAGSGANPGGCSFIGYQAEALTTATNGFFIDYKMTSLKLENCLFTFQNTPCYIRYNNTSLATAAAGQFASFSSINCWYENASGIVPIYTNNGGYLGTEWGLGKNANLSVFSQGDTGGTAGAMQRLLPLYGMKSERLENQLVYGQDWVITKALPYTSYAPAIATSVRKITLDYTYLKTAALNEVIGLLDSAYSTALTKIVGLYAIVNTSFVLGASTITLSVGDPSGTNTEYLLGKTVSGGFTGAIGTADSELGTYLARSTAVQGGHTLFGSNTISAKITSSSGNIGTGTATNLTAGSVDIYVLSQDLQ